MYQFKRDLRRLRLSRRFGDEAETLQWRSREAVDVVDGTGLRIERDQSRSVRRGWPHDRRRPTQRRRRQPCPRPCRTGYGRALAIGRQRDRRGDQPGGRLAWPNRLRRRDRSWRRALSCRSQRPAVGKRHPIRRQPRLRDRARLGRRWSFGPRRGADCAAPPTRMPRRRSWNGSTGDNPNVSQRSGTSCSSRIGYAFA